MVTEIHDGGVVTRIRRGGPHARVARPVLKFPVPLVLLLICLSVFAAEVRAQPGSLPMYGVEFRIASGWVDTQTVPSQSPAHPHHGAGPVFQEAWSRIRESGFNFLRVPIDVGGGPGEVNLLANLCLWARAEDVMLAPTLGPVDEAFAARAGQFIADLVAALDGAGDDHVQAYRQIVMYQLGTTPNHPRHTGGRDLQSAADNVTAAAAAVREAETQALTKHGMSPIPILVEVSFDAPLVEAGGVWRAPLTEENFNLAFEGFNGFASRIAASPNVDVLGLSWYPGSVSTGGAEQFPVVVDALSVTYPGMQLMVTTGYTTAFSSADEQLGYHARVFQNLSDYRDSTGEQPPLLGLVLTEAFDAVEANGGPAGAEAYIQSWDVAAANAELLQLWRGQPADPVVAWWASQTTGRMGLLQMPETAAATPSSGGAGTPAPAPEPAEPDPGEPESTASAGEGSGEPPPAPGTGETSASGSSGAGGLEGLGQTLQGIFEEAVEDIAEQTVEGITGKVEQMWKSKEQEAPAVDAGPSEGYGDSYEGGSGEAGQGVPETGGGDSVAIETASMSTSTPVVGEPVVVQANLVNSGTAPAAGLIAALVDPDDYLIGDEAILEGLSIAPMDAQTVELEWVPVGPGARQVSFKLYDSSYLEVAGVSLGSLEVSAPSAADQSGGVPKTRSLDTPLARSTLRTVRIGYPKASTPVVHSANGTAEVLFTVANPAAGTMPGFDAVLIVNGGVVETILVEDLLPHASRSLAFTALSGYSPTDLVQVSLQRAGEQPVMLAAVEQSPPKTPLRRQVVLVRSALKPVPVKSTQPALKRTSPAGSDSKQPAVRLKLLPQTGSSQPAQRTQGTKRLKVAPSASD